jgi:hypothetical protein
MMKEKRMIFFLVGFDWLVRSFSERGVWMRWLSFLWYDWNWMWKTMKSDTSWNPQLILTHACMTPFRKAPIGVHPCVGCPTGQRHAIFGAGRRRGSSPLLLPYSRICPADYGNPCVCTRTMIR